MSEQQIEQAEATAKRPPERRRNYRVDLRLPLTCYPVDPTTGNLGPSFLATAADFSTSGASVLIDQDMKVPRRICMQLRSSEPPLDLLVMGRVVSVRKHPELRVGLRFEDLASAARAELTRFVFAAAKRFGDGSETASSDGPEAKPLPGNSLLPSPSVPVGLITVAQFAEQIGQTDGSARRLLNTGLVPGARRMNPAAKRSHWLIPATAPADYLALFRRQRVAGTVFEAPKTRPAPRRQSQPAA